MNADLFALLATWAARTSLEALPLALVAVLFWRLRGLPAAWRWWLPALFFVRLAMPQVPAADWHRWNLPALTSTNSFPLEPAAAAAPPTFHFLPLLWALGAVSVFGWMLLSHWRLGRCIARCAGPVAPELERHARWAAARMGVEKGLSLRAMPGWSTLAVRGWWRPELLIPTELAERFTVAQIRGMLLHEMAHVRRRDVLWTWLALGLCALHWFNPLAWLALRRFHADRELACDAAALRALDPAARPDYGEALLRCLECPALRAAPALAPFFRRFPELQQRLQHIMKPTSPTLVRRLLTALLGTALIAITFTTARAQKDGETVKPSPESAPAEKPLRDGEKPKTEQRDGEAGKKKMRDGDGVKPAAREGDQPKKSLRDGDQPKAGLRDGDVKKTGPRDGDRPRKGARDGDAPAKTGPRDGDAPKAGPRDGDRAKPEGEKPEAR